MRKFLVLLLLFQAGSAQTQPTITVHPQGQADISGSTITLNVSASGTAPLKYQWRLDEATLDGKTNSRLVLQNFSALKMGDYDVIVTNFSGSITSQVATLTLDAEYIFTTIAGLSANYGSLDGVGNGARFSGNFRAIAVDNAKNIYVADLGKNAIRKITPAGVVTTGRIHR